VASSQTVVSDPALTSGPTVTVRTTSTASFDDESDTLYATVYVPMEAVFTPFVVIIDEEISPS